MAGVHAALAGAKGFQPVVATGGVETEITISGVKYRLHAFTSSGTFSVVSPGTEGQIDFLLVGGGGPGGGRRRDLGDSTARGGGGGGGELIVFTGHTITAGNKTVTIGAGGVSGLTVDGTPPTQGESTVFDTFTAIGGGYGGNSVVQGPNAGGNGGSGGGGGIQVGDQGLSIAATGFGNDGGHGVQGSNVGSCGGGGGAGQAGQNASLNNNGGTGGDGKDYSSLFGTAYGENGWFGGGGGGGVEVPTRIFPGGMGGGGDTIYNLSQNGLPNSGGGGGGANGSGSGYRGSPGHGGSGIVLIRYRL